MWAHSREGVCRCGLCLALERIKLFCGAPERTALLRAFAVEKVRALLKKLLDFAEGSEGGGVGGVGPYSLLVGRPCG